MRDLSADFIASVETGKTKPRIFFEGEFTGGTLRIWTGYTDIVWNGHTWTGAGSILGVSSVQESADIRALSFTISLNGVSSSVIAIALAQCRQGYSGKCWLALLDAAGAIIADPFQAFAGRLDAPDILDAGEACQVSVRYESHLADLQRPRLRHYTPESQKIDYPNDLGFDFVAGLQDAKLPWGRPG